MSQAPLNPPHPGGSLWNHLGGRDSNPRTVAGRRFLRPVVLAAHPPLRLGLVNAPATVRVRQMPSLVPCQISSSRQSSAIRLRRHRLLAALR